MRKVVITSTIMVLSLTVLVGFAYLKPGFTNDDLKEEITTDWKWAKGYTLSYIETMPEDQIHLKPTENARTFAEQMLHITGSNFGFSSQALALESPMTMDELRGLETNEKFHSKQALYDIVEQSYDFVIAGLETFDPASLDEEISMFNQFNVTRTIALKKAFIHQNHHRGQTAPYLRLAGVVPPPMPLFY